MSIASTLAGTLVSSAEAGKTERPSLVHYLTLAFQLGLFILLLWRFDLVNRAFVHLTIFTLMGWSIHYVLPQRFRLWFFILLSLVGIELVFGFQAEQLSNEGLVQGAWIIAIGLALIAFCHLPVRFSVRVLLILAAGGALVAARADLLPAPWASTIWPVIASMFMFRLIIYLYQVRHETKRTRLADSLSYFFMLPNVCFPLFPVVDYQTFRRTYYNDPDRHQIYQTGIRWMFRGAFHLLLYRLIYQNFVTGAEDVDNATDLIQYLLWPFLLYLRVSGTFHIVTGMLRLFGFNLPETHNLYYLAASFTDCWRRINIYWTNFIMNVFYYPIYFRIRVWGNTVALVVATFLAFIITWQLHAYQWFWLRGTWLIDWNDGLFWGFLAILVVANALYEVRFGRRRSLTGAAPSWPETMLTSLRVLGVFLTITILWSFWGANSIDEWLSVWSVLGRTGAVDASTWLALGAVVLAIVIPAIGVTRGYFDRDSSFAKSAGLTVVAAGLALAVSVPDVIRHVAPAIGPTIASLKSSRLNQQDFARLEQGYYENLMDVGAFNPELWEVYRSKPEDWQPLIGDARAARPTGTLPMFELLPSISVKNKGATVRTNRWGMRDQDYSKIPPAESVRIALLGASFVFGTGVENDEVFEGLLERRLNEELSAATGKSFEVLNFAVAGYGPIEMLAMLEHKVFEFEPDHLFYFEHDGISGPNLAKIVKALRTSSTIQFAYLHQLFARAGVDPRNISDATDARALRNRLEPYREEILAWIYRRMVSECRKRGIQPVWVYFPRPEELEGEGPPALEVRLAREAGFTILDLSGVYGDHDFPSLWIARWDHHPNAQGNRLIADKLYSAMRQAEAEGRFKLAPSK